jgi:hypothetical protein
VDKQTALNPVRNMPVVTKDKPNKAAMNGAAQKPLSLSLPSQENEPPTELSDSIVTIYGRKGIGKTSLASQFPNSLTFMFERGRRNLPIRMVPKKEEGQLDWERTLGYVELALEDDSIQTLVFDTVDRAYDRCLEYVCKRLNCKHPNDKNDYGKTWNEVKTEFAALLGVVQDSGKGVVLISHETPKPLTKSVKGLKREDSESVFQYERMEPTCSKQAFETIQEICDFVLYYGFTEEFRTITVRSPNDCYWTSCGVGDTFLNPDGSTINTFRVGNSPQEAYKSLIDAHANRLHDMDYTPPKGK